MVFVIKIMNVMRISLSTSLTEYKKEVRPL